MKEELLKDVVHVIPTDPTRGIIPPQTGFNDPSSPNDPSAGWFYEYEVDPKTGKAQKDELGNKIKKMAPDPKTGIPQPVYYSLKIPRGADSKLVLNKRTDGWLIDQLQECPHCEGVDVYKGKNVSNYNKWYRIEDPLQKNEQLKRERELQNDAWDHARNVNEALVRYYCILLDQATPLPGFDVGTNMPQELMRNLQNYAQNNPKEYLEFVKDIRLDDRMMMALATRAGYVKDVPNRGLVYNAEDGKDYDIGLSREPAINYINEHPQMREEIVRRIDFDKYHRSKVTEKPTPKVDVVKKELEDREKRIKELEDTLKRYEEEQEKKDSLFPQGQGGRSPGRPKLQETEKS